MDTFSPLKKQTIQPPFELAYFLTLKKIFLTVVCKLQQFCTLNKRNELNHTLTNRLREANIKLIILS